MANSFLQITHIKRYRYISETTCPNADSVAARNGGQLVFAKVSKLVWDNNLINMKSQMPGIPIWGISNLLFYIYLKFDSNIFNKARVPIKNH